MRVWVLCIRVYLATGLCAWVLFEGIPLLNVTSRLAAACQGEAVYLLAVHLGSVLCICARSGVVMSLFLGFVCLRI